MKSLAPNLFDERFDDLMKIGRARLRALAPEWTDYNAHDPGITLMELFAWTSEAQLYSLARMRRDERAAYAAFLGIKTGGTRGAAGVIWPDRSDPNSPVASYPRDDGAVAGHGDQPGRHPSADVQAAGQTLWVPGRIRSLRSQTARGGGAATDLTMSNQRGNLTFFRSESVRVPWRCWRSTTSATIRAAFSAQIEKRRRMRCGDRRSRGTAVDRINERFDPANEKGIVANRGDARRRRRPLCGSRCSRHDAGLLASGVLMLDLSSVPTSPEAFTIELRSPRGFARPPRWLRVEPSVIPVLQGRVVSNELNTSIAKPNWCFTLANPGVRFEADKEPVSVMIVDPDTRLELPWKRVDRLVDQGPTSPCTSTTHRRTNHLRQRRERSVGARQAQVLATYAVSDAEQGNVGRNRKWQVAGFQV
jgi:hypothetical protein